MIENSLIDSNIFTDGRLFKEKLLFAEELDKAWQAKSISYIVEILNSLNKKHLPLWVMSLCQIYGVVIEQREPELAGIPHRTQRQGTRRFNEADILCLGKVFRVRCVGPQQSRMVLREGTTSLLIGNIDIGVEVILLSTERHNRNDGVYYPQLEGEVGHEAIRFNPKNEGRCPGGCLYCQRAFHIPTESEIRKRLRRTGTEVVEVFCQRYGHEAIQYLRHALVVTELYGDGNKYLDVCEEISTALRQQGFSGEFSALAQEVRTSSQIRRLWNICNGYEFCVTLEHFQRRTELMAKAKAIELETIDRMLSEAHSLGFRRIAINYILGLDTIEGAKKHFDALMEKGHVRYIGLNVFYPYTDKQLGLFAPGAQSLRYYVQLVEYILSIGLKPLRPQLYERFPAIAGGIGQMWL